MLVIQVQGGGDAVAAAQALSTAVGTAIATAYASASAKTTVQGQDFHPCLEANSCASATRLTNNSCKNVMRGIPALYHLMCMVCASWAGSGVGAADASATAAATATATAKAFADAVAKATNNNAQAVAAAKAEDIQKAVASALATANASVLSTGTLFISKAFAQARMCAYHHCRCFISSVQSPLQAAERQKGHCYLTCRGHSASEHTGHLNSGQPGCGAGVCKCAGCCVWQQCVRRFLSQQWRLIRKVKEPLHIFFSC